MILVDAQIREKINSCGLIENYTSANIQNILYDLVAEKFIEHREDGNNESTIYDLLPLQSVIVATKEIITLPPKILGRVVGKNSRIREGLMIESPVYQPGHRTRIYFRITNISNSSIRLQAERSYGSIMFETLDRAPEHPYDGTYQDEIDYSHLGDYSSEYEREIQAVEKKIDEFKNFEKSVYANVITILTIFIAIFSIINVNITLASEANVSWAYFIVFNLCTVGSISLLSDFIMYHLSPQTYKKFLWLIPVLCFVGAAFCAFKA